MDLLNSPALCNKFLLDLIGICLCPTNLGVENYRNCLSKCENDNINIRLIYINCVFYFSLRMNWDCHTMFGGILLLLLFKDTLGEFENHYQ